MPSPKQAAETMARCPGCRKDIRSDPDESCTLCHGVGLVPGKVAAEFRAQAKVRAAR